MRFAAGISDTEQVLWDLLRAREWVCDEDAIYQQEFRVYALYDALCSEVELERQVSRQVVWETLTEYQRLLDEVLISYSRPWTRSATNLGLAEEEGQIDPQGRRELARWMWHLVVRAVAGVSYQAAAGAGSTVEALELELRLALQHDQKGTSSTGDGVSELEALVARVRCASNAMSVLLWAHARRSRMHPRTFPALACPGASGPAAHEAGTTGTERA